MVFFLARIAFCDQRGNNSYDIIDWYEKQTNPNIMIVGDFNLPEID